MSELDVKTRVVKILRDVLDNKDLIIQDNTCARDVEGWDSLAHISIIVAIENEFRIKFNLAELKQLKTVNDLMVLIEGKAK